MSKPRHIKIKQYINTDLQQVELWFLNNLLYFKVIQAIHQTLSGNTSFSLDLVWTSSIHSASMKASNCSSVISTCVQRWVTATVSVAESGGFQRSELELIKNTTKSNIHVMLCLKDKCHKSAYFYNLIEYQHQALKYKQWHLQTLLQSHVSLRKQVNEEGQLVGRGTAESLTEEFGSPDSRAATCGQPGRKVCQPEFLDFNYIPKQTYLT